MFTVTVYGIPNCDTVKKVRAWFDGQGVDMLWHDFKKQGVPGEALQEWIAAVGWERLVNRQGSTWRKLSDAVKAGVCNDLAARRLMRAEPSVIRRPVVRWADGLVSVGFDEAVFAALAAALVREQNR